MAAPDAPWALQTAWAAMQSLAEGDPARQLDALARMPASRLRDRCVENAIKALAEKDSAAAEARLDLFTEPRRRARLQAEILGKLAERDPSAALARLAELAPDLTAGVASTQLVTHVLRGAGKKDPDAALAAVDGLPEELRTPALGAALTGWAEQHPADALAWGAANGVELSEAKGPMDFGDYGGASWQSLLSIAFQSDRAKTFAWLRSQPASLERDEMLRAGIWSGTKEEKLQIYAELTPQGQVEAVRAMLGGYRSDATEFEPWVKAQPAGAARQAAIQVARQRSGEQFARPHRHPRRRLARRPRARRRAARHRRIAFQQRPTPRPRFRAARHHPRRPRSDLRADRAILVLPRPNRRPRLGRQRSRAFPRTKARPAPAVRRPVTAPHGRHAPRGAVADTR